MKSLFCFMWCALLINLSGNLHAADLSPLQTELNNSAKANLFTLVVFHKGGDGKPEQVLKEEAQSAVKSNPAKITTTVVNISDGAEKTLLEKYGISRAPMPMLVVVAPNGAVTGLFPRSVTQEQISSAVVSPVMMSCMKELQDQKLVFVCMSKEGTTEIPLGVKELQNDPAFKDRISVVSMNLADQSEAKFHQQMKLKPQLVTYPYAVLIAPPGVLVGHFNGESTATQIAAEIHKSGKCCDDPNCKHGK